MSVLDEKELCQRLELVINSSPFVTSYISQLFIPDDLLADIDFLCKIVYSEDISKLIAHAIEMKYFELSSMAIPMLEGSSV